MIKILSLIHKSFCKKHQFHYNSCQWGMPSWHLKQSTSVGAWDGKEPTEEGTQRKHIFAAFTKNLTLLVTIVWPFDSILSSAQQTKTVVTLLQTWPHSVYWPPTGGKCFLCLSGSKIKIIYRFQLNLQEMSAIGKCKTMIKCWGS